MQKGNRTPLRQTIIYNKYNNMKVELIKLSQVSVNKANPREIKKDKFNKLVDSILVFPKMREIRPTVIDTDFTALGGNQRLQAQNFIAQMELEDIADRLCKLEDFAKKSERDRKKLIEFWSDWLEAPSIPVIFANTLTEDEKKQFIIKDNVNFGSWDYDKLSCQWDSKRLQDWGMDVWNEDAKIKDEANEDQPISEEDRDDDFTDLLPPELDGVNLNPNDLPKLTGSDDRPNDYVIITYLPEDKFKLIDFLGINIENWTEKVCYTLDEILLMQNNIEK